jgi:ligand-binding SRPBCC domain-containing protein
MKIYLQTKVEQEARAVFESFDQELFEALAPPFPPFKLKRFDGSNKGDLVHVQIWNAGWKDWISEITDSWHKEGEFAFVDEGKTLPWPLKHWRHRHIIRESGSGAIIIDDIEFSTGNSILDRCIYPALYTVFAYRGPIYRRRFNKGAKH